MFEIPDIQLNQYGKPARIMFLAPYAPDAPDFSKKPYTGNGGYPQYHYNIYKAIQDIGYDVLLQTLFRPIRQGKRGLCILPDEQVRHVQA